jgi:hypothetical protein
MLSEAWHPSMFTDEYRHMGADDADRLYLINWLQHWATHIGLLSASEIRSIRGLSEQGNRDAVMRRYGDQMHKRYAIGSNDTISGLVEPLAKSGKRIGIFHGTFAPPTWIHLSLAQYYRQMCDFLLVGIDGDALTDSRKAHLSSEYPFRMRHAIWSGFPHIADGIIEIPETFFDGKQYDEHAITDFYRQFGIGIVFFNKRESGRAQRIRQIRAAGAIPFDHDLYMSKVYSSTQLRALKESNASWFTSLLGTRKRT